MFQNSFPADLPGWRSPDELLLSGYAVGSLLAKLTPAALKSTDGFFI